MSRHNFEISDKASEILESIDPIYRDTAINFGIQLMSKHNLYKTFLVASQNQIVETPEVNDSEDTMDADEKGSSQPTTTQAPSKPKPQVDWGTF